MQYYARAFLIQVALSPLAWLVAFIVTGSTRAAFVAGAVPLATAALVLLLATRAQRRPPTH